MVETSTTSHQELLVRQLPDSQKNGKTWLIRLRKQYLATSSHVTLTLFFTYGVSLKNWAESGLLHREIRLYQELVQRHGVKVQFLTYGDASDRQWEKELQGISLIPVYEGRSRSRFRLLALFQSLIIPWVVRNKLRQTDIFKTNQIKGGWVAVISKWMFHKPLLVRCGYEYYDFARKRGRSTIVQIFSRIMSRLIYSHADQIHVATSSDFQLIVDLFGVSPQIIRVCPNWVDHSTFKPFGLIRRKNILCVGRLTKQKNMPLLFEALRGTGLRLDILGEGTERAYLENFARENDLSVEFLGRVPNDQMPDLYNRYSVFVICSLYEGNPKTLLEAMACGCAVIGTNVPGIRELINHEKNGLLLLENPDDLQNGIMKLMADEALRNTLSQQARQDILETNSLESALDVEYRVYSQLINQTIK